MRQPEVIIMPLISPPAGAPSAVFGKSASSTDSSVTSPSDVPSLAAKSARERATAVSLLYAIRFNLPTRGCPTELLYDREPRVVSAAPKHSAPAREKRE